MGGKNESVDFADAFADELEEEGGANDQASQHAAVLLSSQRDVHTFNLFKKQLTVRPQARKTFDPDKLDELAKSIKEEGQLQPIRVQKIGDNEFELINGERRYRAIFNLLKEKTIRAEVKENNYSSDINKRFAQLAENLQRDNYRPLELAEELLFLKGDLKLTNAKLAERLNKSVTHVSKTISLLDDEQTPPKVRELIKNNKLAATTWLNDKENVLAAIENGITSFSNTGSDGLPDNAKKKSNKKTGKKGAKKMKMVSIPFETAYDMAMIYKNLCKRYKLSAIDVEEQPTKKALMAILHTRTPDILEKLVK